MSMDPPLWKTRAADAAQSGLCVWYGPITLQGPMTFCLYNLVVPTQP